ncbi:hypothetical protein [Alloyangia pacifica]|uniref:hypothetical protein n=1 Tax=Alloyangia pacifica TaxID=311180 RepID=UPI001CD7A583|nr:hypothetical protein [Alloyangia pacifica]MCA0996178.1 hypothetical protein [Alloyangia pacifica]
MTRALVARIKRLEQRNKPPRRTHTSVVQFNAQGHLIGRMPKSGRYMAVTNFGTADEWAALLTLQQARLINEGTAHE